MKRWAGYHWTCTAGCNTTNTTLSTLVGLRYTDVGSFLGDEWEAAVGMFKVTFDKKDELHKLQIGFQRPNGTLVDSLGEGQIRLAIRNDTNRTNISPALNVFPIYRVSFGRSLRVRLFPFDGDGDDVHCHWESLHGAGAGIVLCEEECEILVNATAANGFHANRKLAVSVYAEDHSHTPVSLGDPVAVVTTGPFSRTPVMITISVGSQLADATVCDDGPLFSDGGNIPPHLTYSQKSPVSGARFTLLTKSENDIILTTGPRGMTYNSERLTANHTTKAVGVLYTHGTADRGIYQVCGMAYTHDGIPGESRCVTMMLNDTDDCSSTNPCTERSNGTCTNLFDYYTCTYPMDGDNQIQYGNRSGSYQTEMDMCTPTNPCTDRPNGTCINFCHNYTCTYPTTEDNLTQQGETTTQQEERTQHEETTLSLLTVTAATVTESPRPVLREKEDNLGLKVGLPVGLSVLVLTTVAAIAAFLKHYWAGKKTGVAVGPSSPAPGDVAMAVATATADDSV